MSVNRTLSQTQGAIKKNYRVNNAFESFPTIQTMVDVAAASDTSVMAATLLASGVTTTISGATLTDPGEYRAFAIKGNQSGVAGTVVITGYDRGGKVVTDRIASSGATSVSGVIPMSEIISVVLPAYVAATDTISVGVSSKLGLYRPISSTADVVMEERKATADSAFTIETLGTVNATYGTVIPSGTIVADDSFRFSINTKIF